MNELKEYILDTTNPKANFDLGRWYEEQKHFSPASGFFLRAAELSESNLDLRYESLIRCYFCYNRLKRRDYTCESLLKSAIVLAPERPEAYYFLSEHYERKNDWLNVYLFSSLGLEHGIKPSKFTSYMYFEHMYQLHFQKARSVWWMGKPNESRKIYRYILDNYIDELRPEYRDLLENNLSRLAGGPEYESFKAYKKDDHLDRFKFKFKGIEDIEKNFSQIYQDMFVLALLDGKREGTYLEIGSSKPFYGNNTALLEQSFDWKGVGIENDFALYSEYEKERKNPVIHKDALIANYEKILSENLPEQKTIDYLQIDIEPARNTFQALMAVPFEKYDFRIITYEHDDYVDITKSYKIKSRRYLESMGYTLIVNDVAAVDNCSFEDWWVKKDLINADILAKMTQLNDNKFNLVENYVLN